jgi:hypothetical protein
MSDGAKWLARKDHPLGEASRQLPHGLQELGVEVLNVKRVREGRAGSPSRPFLWGEKSCMISPSRRAARRSAPTAGCAPAWADPSSWPKSQIRRHLSALESS